MSEWNATLCLLPRVKEVYKTAGHIAVTASHIAALFIALKPCPKQVDPPTLFLYVASLAAVFACTLKSLSYLDHFHLHAWWRLHVCYAPAPTQSNYNCFALREPTGNILSIWTMQPDRGAPILLCHLWVHHAFLSTHKRILLSLASDSSCSQPYKRYHMMTYWDVASWFSLVMGRCSCSLP